MTTIPLFFLIFSIRAEILSEHVGNYYESVKGIATLLTNCAEPAEKVKDNLVAVLNQVSPDPVEVSDYKEAVALLVDKKILAQGNLTPEQIESEKKKVEDKLFEQATKEDTDFDAVTKEAAIALVRLSKISQLSYLNSQKDSGKSITISYKKDNFIANTKVNVYNRCVGAVNSRQINKEQFNTCKTNLDKSLDSYVRLENESNLAFREVGGLWKKPRSVLEYVIKLLIGTNEVKKEVLLDLDSPVSKRISELIPLWLSDKEAIESGLELAKWLLNDLNTIETKLSIEIFGKENTNEQAKKASLFFTKICQQILEIAAANDKLDDAFSIALIYFNYHFLQYTYAKPGYIAYYNSDSKGTFRFVNPTDYVPGDISDPFAKVLEKYNVVSILINVDKPAQIVDDDKRAVISNFSYITDLSVDERNALQLLQKYVGQKGIVNFAADQLVFELLQAKYFKFILSAESKDLNDANIYNKFEEYLKYNYFTGTDDEKNLQMVMRIANYLKSKKTVAGISLESKTSESVEQLKQVLTSKVFLESYEYFSKFAYNQVVNEKNELIAEYNESNQEQRKVLEPKIDALEAKFKNAQKLVQIAEPTIEDLQQVMSEYVDAFASVNELPSEKKLII